MNATLTLGLIGLSIILGLNLFGFLVLRQAAARFFAGDWWSVCSRRSSYGGMVLGLSFKRSVIERVAVDLDQALKAIQIINERVKASHRLLGDL